MAPPHPKGRKVARQQHQELFRNEDVALQWSSVRRMVSLLAMSYAATCLAPVCSWWRSLLCGVPGTYQAVTLGLPRGE